MFTHLDISQQLNANVLTPHRDIRMHSRPVLMEVFLRGAFFLFEKKEEAEVGLSGLSAAALSPRFQLREGEVVLEVFLEGIVCLSRLKGALGGRSDGGYGSQKEAPDREEQHCESCSVYLLRFGLDAGGGFNFEVLSGVQERR
jgi:hypothetical protein